MRTMANRPADPRGRGAVGVAGLGRMGGAIAERLRQSGYDVLGWNRSAVKAPVAGVRLVSEASELALHARFVLTSLSGPEAVSELYLRSGGLLDVAPPGTVFINTSAVDPGTSRSVADACVRAGCDFLDAPVAGSVELAKEGQLAFFVGGDAEVVRSAQPIWQALGRVMRHVGGHGTGSALKLITNGTLATVVQAVAESVAMGDAAGLPDRIIIDAPIDSSAGTPVIERKRATIIEGTYLPATFTIRQMAKDLSLLRLLLATSRTQTPVLNETAATVNAAAQIAPDADFTYVVHAMRWAPGEIGARLKLTEEPA